MVRPEVIHKKLQQLDEYLALLEDMRKEQKDAFLNEPLKWGSAERFLHMALEAVNDIANHIIAEKNLGTVDRYRDIPRKFAKQAWINEDLKDKWIEMMKFRNLLVHGYAKVDRSVVYSILQNNLDDIKKLKRVFAQFL